MTFKAIVWKMMKVNYRRYFLYVACNVFVVLFLFLFASIYWNNTIHQMKQSDSFDTVLAVPAAALIVFLFFFIQYAHQMFMKERKSELGIMLAVGMTPGNITRLVVLENLGIGILSLVIGLVNGAVFARLFVLVFTSISKLEPGIFHLSVQMFSYTTCIYSLLFLLTLLVTIVQIHRQTLLTTMQTEQTIDSIKTTSPLFGLIGIGCLVVSITGLYATYKTHEYLLFLWAMLTFFGLYLTLAFGVHLVLYFIKGNPGLYYRSVLLFSSVKQKQRKLTSLLTLTSIMVMLTTLYCTILLFIANDEKERFLQNNPADVALVMVEQQKEQQLVEEQLMQQPIQQWHSFRSIEIVTKNYDGSQSYLQALTEVEYERLTGQQVELKAGQCIMLLNQTSGYGDLVNLGLFAIGQEDCELIHVETKQYMANVNRSSEYIVLQASDFERFEASSEAFIQYDIHYEDWQAAAEEMGALVNWLGANQFSVSPIFSKEAQYKAMREENAVLFYLMTFLSILFYVGTFILLYLNLLADIDAEKAKCQKLMKIGITKQALRSQFRMENALLFFLPTVLGMLLALLYVIGMSMKDVNLAENRRVFYYFILISGTYFVIQLSFYLYAQSKLFRKVWESVR